MTKLKKGAKARKRRKDYEKKRNIAHTMLKNPNVLGLKPGGGILPESKKYRLSKKTKATQKKARSNVIKTATNN